MRFRVHDESAVLKAPCLDSSGRYLDDAGPAANRTRQELDFDSAVEEGTIEVGSWYESGASHFLTSLMEFASDGWWDSKFGALSRQRVCADHVDRIICFISAGRHLMLCSERGFAVLDATMTPNLLGVKLSGYYDDLDKLYDAVWTVCCTEGDDFIVRKDKK